MIRKSFLFAAVGMLLTAGQYALADISPEVQQLQQQWAEINYQLQGKAQEKAFAELVEQAEAVVAAQPDSAEALIWSGIIKSTYAGARGGLGALSVAKSSRRDLEKALEKDPQALQGSAYTSLGALYYSVPGWPVGFGDDDKARELLEEALNIAPDSIDANYFYAEFLHKQKENDKAREYYLKAQHAEPRPGREVADAGRQSDIRKGLAAMDH